ncbi:MAG: TolC family protein [Acidobacteria bacterium]|nr:MAG: TolC family protein [Acidobacteriota bacterium]
MMVVAATGVAAGSSAGQSAIRMRTHALEPAEALEVRAPVKLEAPELSLTEAVQLTVFHNPRIQLAKQDLARSLGQLQQAKGAFDHTLGLAPGFSWFNQELIDSELDQIQEFHDTLARTAETFSELHQQFVKALENDGQEPLCPAGLDFDNDDIVIGGESLATDVIIRFRGIDIDLICDSNDVRFTRRVLEAAAGSNLQIARLLEEQRSDLVERRRSQFRLRSEIAEEVSTKAALALERLGPLPMDVTSKQISIDLRWVKFFRSGISVRGDISLKSQKDNFDDKPLDPTFGRLPIQNRFPNFLTLGLVVPLGKGRGESASASERASEAGVAARRDRLRHLISAEVFRTTLSYFNLIAAWDTVLLLEESAERHRNLVEITEDLIEADEIPASQINRVRAQTAAVFESGAASRLALLDGRFGLADTIGLSVEKLVEAPLPSEGFTMAVSGEPSADVLIDLALEERRDARALSQAQDAQQFLTNAARADLKRRIDFLATGGLSTFYESPYFRYLPDEVDDPPSDTPLRFYNPRGFYRSTRRDYKPFFRVQLTFDLPFKNNVAKGRLLREQSLLTTSQIDLTDLERSVRNNVIEVRGTLGLAVAALQARRETVAHYDDTLETARARYQNGDITLVDMLITEEDLLREQLELVRDLQIYLSILSRLRFETGTIVTYEQENTSLEFVSFDPSMYVVP